jgi:hypothetical protein
MATPATHYARTPKVTGVLDAAALYARAAEAQVAAAEDLAAVEAPDAIAVSPDRIEACNRAHSEACDALEIAERNLKRAALLWHGSDTTLAD